MLVNNSKKYQFATGLVMKDQVLDVVDEAKLLGTYITSDLKWNKNTDYLIKEANERMRLLHAALARFKRHYEAKQKGHPPPQIVPIYI